MKLCNLFTGRTTSVPSPPRAGCVLGSDGAGNFTIIRVVGEGMLVYQHPVGTWGTSCLELPPGEEFSMSIDIPHAVIDGSILYFLTVKLRTGEISAIRWIDFRRSVDGTSSKLLSWSSLPSSYLLYELEDFHDITAHPYGRPFTGSIAVAGGKLFVACLREIDPAKPRVCTVALLACGKQGKKLDLVSEMRVCSLEPGIRALCGDAGRYADHLQRSAAFLLPTTLQRMPGLSLVIVGYMMFVLSDCRCDISCQKGNDRFL